MISKPKCCQNFRPINIKSDDLLSTIKRNNDTKSINQTQVPKIITENDKNIFLDTYFGDRNEEIKALIKDLKSQETLSWAKILCSPEFRKNFSSKDQIKQLPDDHQKIFEDIFIMSPLNYIYWREGIKYEDLFPVKNQGHNPVCISYALAALIVLASKRKIGSGELNFEDVKNHLVKELANTNNHSEQVNIIKTKIMPHYNLRFEPVLVNDINHFNPNGSYLLYLYCFWLSKENWDKFDYFFNDENKKNKTLTDDDLDKTDSNTNGIGHAVILIDTNKKKYMFKFLGKTLGK